LYFMYISLPGGDDNFSGVARYGDCNPGFWHNAYSVLPLLARRLRDPVAQWLNSEQDGGVGLDVWRYLWYDSTVPAIDPFDLPKWHYFDTYGLFCWRSSWSNDASYFTIKSGQHFHGHAHPDDGQFMIHRTGVPYITDSGYTNPRYTSDQNVLLNTGTGQVGDGSEWGDFGQEWPNSNIWGEMLHVLATGKPRDEPADFFNVLCDPTPMYTSAKLTQWNRESIGLGDFFLLRDTMTASSAVDFELRLHSFVSRKDSKPFYDYKSDRYDNPFTYLSNSWWEIDARNQAPQPPNLLAGDLSAEIWTAGIEETWIDDHYENTSVRLGNYLRRQRTDTETSSLMAFGFDDQLADWTVSPWTNAGAEGTHVNNTTNGNKIIEVLWPLNGASCAGSAGWDVTGKMGGRRYKTSPMDKRGSYFGREVTLLKNESVTLLTATTPLSFHARLETPFSNSSNSLITSTAANLSTGTFYCPYEPYIVMRDGENVSFDWSNSELILTIPAGEHTFKIGIIPEPVFIFILAGIAGFYLINKKNIIEP
jgi:hypothetical protein